MPLARLHTAPNLGLSNLGLSNLGLSNLGLSNLGLSNLGLAILLGLWSVLLVSPPRAAATPGGAAETPSFEVLRLEARLESEAGPGASDGWRPAWPFFAEHSDTVGVVQLRAEVVVHDPRLRLLHVSVLGSTEVFWDGELVARGGVVGPSLEAEVPGPLIVHALVPPTGSGTRHRLEVRVSNFYSGGRSRLYGIWLTDPTDSRSIELESPWRQALLAMLLGAMATAGLYFVILPADRPGEVEAANPARLFGLLCLASVVLASAEAVRHVVDYRYDWHFPRLQSILGLTVIASGLLVAWVASAVGFPHRRILATSFALLAVPAVWLPRGYDPRTFFLWTLALGLCAALGLWALLASRRRRRGFAILAGVGLGVGVLAVDSYRFVDRSVFWILGALSIVALAGAGLRRREQQRAARLRAARLESQLLQRSLQPHFLLNTLTSVLEWIEQDPAHATRFVEELAGEFRLLSEIAPRLLVPLETELRLCRMHLRIMSFRQDREHRLIVEGLEAEPGHRPVDRLEVPPALFHTLLENALTHNRYQGEVVFRLWIERVPDGSQGRETLRYTLDAPLGATRAAAEDGDAVQREGTGLRFVRARLEEAFGRAWSLRSAAEGEVWRTMIEVGPPRGRT